MLEGLDNSPNPNELCRYWCIGREFVDASRPLGYKLVRCKSILVIYSTGTWTDPLYPNYTEFFACWMNREKGLVITELHGTFTTYAIEDGKISTLDSSVLNANGSILHGRYSE